MKSKFRLLAVLVVLSVLFTACAQPAPAPAPAAAPPTTAPAQPTAVPAAAGPDIKGKVTIWYDSGAAWNDFIAQFNAEMAKRFPGIAIEWVTQDAAQLSTKLVAAFATQQGPDIALGSQARMVPAEQEFKAWADLSPRLESDPELKEIVAALPAVHVASYKKDSKLWGLPQVVQTVGIFVRQSWLDKLGAKAPETWDEMTDLAIRFTKEDPDGNGQNDTFGYCFFGAPGVTNSAGTQFLYDGAAAGIEYPIVDANGKPAFNTPEGQAVAKYLYKWAHEAKVIPPDTPTYTHKEYYAIVQAGKCGMGRVGAWNVGAWSSSEIHTDYTVIPFPPLKKGEPNYQVAWSNAIVMSDAAKDKEATYAVFKALESKWGQEMFYKLLTSSARVDLDWATLATSPQLLYFTKQQPQYALELTFIDTWLPTVDILAGKLNAMLADSKVDPVQALADAEKEAMAKYDEIRK